MCTDCAIAHNVTAIEGYPTLNAAGRTDKRILERLIRQSYCFKDTLQSILIVVIIAAA